jgi:glyoxylase-like metal-dependent hydrolase (beta-lactamase superfamily II)
VSAARAQLDYPHPDGPAPGTTRAIAPEVRWVRMAVPFPPEHINLWLVEDGDGWAIVDCGLGLDETRAAWEQVFAHELDGRPVTRVIVTHFHPDHLGCGTWLAERWGVDVWMTEGEWMTARGVHAVASETDLDIKIGHYRRNGVPADQLETYRTPPNAFYRKMVPGVPGRFVRIRGGDPLRIGARDWQVIIGRGHAPEHACLWSRDLGVLICGDILLPRISPNVSVWPTEPFGNPLADYLDALAGFDGLPADTLVLPAHGQPYRGVHARIAELRGHHAQRLDKLADALAERPRSAVECFPLLYRREIGRENMGLALGEALAHLHLLLAQNRVRRVAGPDGILRFERR